MLVRLRRISLALAFSLPACHAQTGPAPSVAVAVPTTKILAIGLRSSTMTEEQRKTIMPKEVPATVRLYLNGKIDQWWVREDGKGVVFLMNVTTVDEARTILEKLPLGQAKLMQFEFLPLGPLSPLRYLFNDPPQPPK